MRGCERCEHRAAAHGTSRNGNALAVSARARLRRIEVRLRTRELLQLRHFHRRHRDDRMEASSRTRVRLVRREKLPEKSRNV